MEGRYQFSSPEWDDRSDTVKDLVSLFSVHWFLDLTIISFSEC